MNVIERKEGYHSIFYKMKLTIYNNPMIKY